MKVFQIKIAGYVIGIFAIFNRAYNVFKDFLINEKADFCICSSMADFDKELHVYQETFHDEGPSNVHIEIVSLLRKIADRFIDDNILLLHGSALSFGQRAFVFTAPSGTGKTTHIMKWLEHCPDAFVVNGDKPFIRFNDDGTVLACGSPWAGKENLYTNTMVPLKSIILMERAEDNHIERISFAEAFPKLLEQTYRPEDPDKMRKTLKLMQRLNPAVSFWRFQCNNFKDDCFDVAYNALVGQDQ